MSTIKCNLINCEYHGIEVCMRDRIVIDNFICTNYKQLEPVHITPSDLLPPFDCKCHKIKGKFVSDNNVKVIK